MFEHGRAMASTMRVVSMTIVMQGKTMVNRPAHMTLVVGAKLLLWRNSTATKTNRGVRKGNACPQPTCNFSKLGVESIALQEN